MSERSARRFASGAVACLLAWAATGIMVEPASAADRVLSGTHTFGQVAAACGASGGSFNVHTSGGYSCTMGDLTQVNCNAKGKCSSSCGDKGCPDASKGLKGVLRPPASAGTASAAGGTSGNNKPMLNSVRNPVVVQRSGGGHSGGSKH